MRDRDRMGRYRRQASSPSSPSSGPDALLAPQQSGAPLFFRIHSALCLDPQAGGKVAKRRVLCFLAALWAFAFRPLLGVR